MAEDFVDELQSLSAAQRAEVVEARLQKAVFGSAEKLLGEVLAAAAVVAANVPAGDSLPWNEDYPGIASWLRPDDVSGLADLAGRALEAYFRPAASYWQSWVNEDDRAESMNVLERIQNVLRGQTT